jgi:hypothetical protein
MFATETEPMARKKTEKPAPEPLPDFIVRVPGEYRAPILAIQKQTRRTMTVIVQIALEKYFRDVKQPFTPNWPEVV